MLKSIPAFAALLTASVLVVPTVTQAAKANFVRVSYADLNLANEAGATALERRIAYAARSVCGEADLRDLRLMRATNVCRDQAITDAQPAFHSALAAARNPSVTVLDATIAVIAK
jgi:UrcA family protein